MGEVFLAEDTELERLVAFKVLPVSLNFQRRLVTAVAATVVRLD
jgi:serine/threonine protein kinase